MTSRRHHLAVVLVAAAYVLGFLVAQFLTVSNEAAAGHDMAANQFVLALSFLSLPLAGALIEWHRPRNATGRLLLGIGFGAVLAVIGTGWAGYGLRAHPHTLPGGLVGAWVSTWGLVVGFGLAPWFLATFPTGTITTRWLRAVSRVAVVALIVATVAEAFAPGPIDGLPAGVAEIDNPLGVDRLKGALGAASGIALFVLIVFLLMAIVDLVVRYRRSSGDTRMQLRWLAIAAPFLPLSIIVSGLLPPAAGDTALYIGQPLFLVGTLTGVVVAVLKYRLYDLDLFVRRSLVFAVLTGLVVAGYIGLVAGIGAVLEDRSGPLPSLVAVGLVAVAFEPARRRVQRVVDRWAYGRRAEPYAVLSALGEQIEAALAPDAALHTIIATIKDELRLAGVAIDLNDGVRVAQVGTLGATEDFAVAHQGRHVGTLVVTQRTPGETFTDTERRLLMDLARQAGAAVHARELTAALQRSREQLVADREEERRRMRRDLHDGLGPTLAGMLLRAEVAGDLVNTDPAAAAHELETLKQQLQGATDDVRRLVHGLRPPALDELGLVPAIRAQAASLSRTDGVAIDVDAPSDTPTLPAAVEVAVYRVVAEAMTNVVRHAHARRCHVLLAFDDPVVVEVSDDGTGFDPAQPGGVGLRSMRERAAELGGTVEVTASGSGTRVRLAIPVDAS